MSLITDAFAEVGHILFTIVTNKIFYITFSAWLLAQTLKVIFYFVKFKKFDFRLFIGTGGMPSSHTAAVTAGTVTVGLSQGWGSPVFMVCLLYCIVTISDAMGVRRAAGKQAVILNKMMDEMWRSEFKYEKRLKEWLGHTPLEALAGMVIGILLPVVMF
jgi:acid phosphatase family membrane protein YuiD